MTAEEIAEKLPIGIHDRDEAVQLIKEYDKERCKEQRELCKGYTNTIHAPEPEML